MSVKSSGSHDGPTQSTGDIIRSGVLKKMKTARRKFFVLRAETSDALARLEYYDSEKKFRSGVPPKRCIPLKTCFDINKRQDTKHKNVIALYTKDDCFCIVLESEDELKNWLKDLLTLQHGEEIPEGETLKPKFEYVWQVNLCERGLGAGRIGLYRLCLTDKTVTLVKIDEPMPTVIELSLASVRSCGNLKNFFFLEVGRSSNLGAGEFWFEADDTNIASNLQATVSHRFKLIREKAKLAATSEINDIQPKGRIRSSSATESSKINNKKFNSLTARGGSILPQDNASSDSNLTPPVTTSSSTTTTVSGVAMSIYNHILQRSSGKRRHSISGGGSSWSGGVNHQRTQSLPLATPVVTTCCTNSPLTTTDNTNLTNVTLTNHQQAKKSATGGGKCSFRERCDSMPSRPRTSSEGNHAVPSWWKPYSVPYRAVHHRDASHSPPTGSPISPPSDSTGSSYSLPDEHDGPHDMEHQRMYSTLTPDEVIAEEECPESPRAIPHTGNYLPMNHYTDMGGPHYGGHNFPSNSASMSSVTSGTPSTDMRFADYPLDKVFSYVSADDEDARPCRAYSVGSKPPETQLASTPENARVRAFSVGSKTKKYNRVLPPHHQPPGVKSNSAPLLAPNSRVGSSHGSINNPMDDLMEMDFSSETTRSRTSTNASGSSEARAACNHRNSSCSNGSRSGFLGFLDHLAGGDHNKKTPEGYVEMKPGNLRTTSGSSDVSPYVDMTQGQRASSSTAPYMDMSGNNVPSVGHAYSPYLDMSGNNANGGNNGASAGNTVPQVGNDDSPYMDMSGGNNNGRENYMDMTGSSPVRSSPRPSMTLSEYVRQFGRNSTPDNNRNSDYMEMAYPGRRRANSNSSMPRVATSPGAWTNDHNSDYLDMTGRTNRRSERTNSFGSQMSSSPHLDSVSPKYSDYMAFGVQDRIPEASAHDIEGYVQMTPGDFTNIGTARHQRQSSTDSMDNEHGDYLNMSGMNLGASNLKTKPTKERSQPISIQTTSNNQGVKNSSPISSISSLLGRKSSPMGTSPNMHLPLSPYSSLPRQKSPRKYSHTGSSKDSSSVSSSVTTTPSSSSTMFPLSLNSPTSPAAGPSKTGTPTTMKVPVSILNMPYKSGGSSTRKKVNNEDDYAMMDFEPSREVRKVVDDTPYMNYCPPGPNAPKTPVTLISTCDDYSDYAIMKPGTLPTKSTTLPRAKSSASSGLASPLANHLSSVVLTDRQTMCFRPIRERDERMSSPRPGDQVPEKLTQDDKTLETANMEVEEGTAYDTLKSPSGPVSPAAKVSRPNSSNSEKIKSGTQRPASTTGTEKNSRPSSVCSEGLNSRLGSNSSVYSSSSSTSTVVGALTIPDQQESDQPSPPKHVIKLHYASLDLSNDPEDRKSPRSIAQNEVNMTQGGTTFVYADIDFIRSEEMSRSNAQGSGCTAIKNS